MRQHHLHQEVIRNPPLVSESALSITARCFEFYEASRRHLSRGVIRLEDYSTENEFKIPICYNTPKKPPLGYIFLSTVAR